MPAKFGSPYGDVAVSYTALREAAPARARAAIREFDRMGGNLWVVSADERHWEQFASKKDRAALAAMEPRAARRLMHMMGDPEYWEKEYDSSYVPVWERWKELYGA